MTNNIDSDYPPTLLIHAKNDHLIDLQQVNDFYDFLKEKQIKTELYLVENGHSSELINQNPEAIDKIIDFLKIQMPCIDSKVKEIRVFCESNSNDEIIKKYSRYFKEGYDGYGRFYFRQDIQ